MPEIKTESMELMVGIPINALNTLTLQALGMYVLLHAYGELEDEEDMYAMLDNLHGKSSVNACVNELISQNLIKIEEDGEGNTKMDR